jgi:hypothetical protein
MAHEMCGWLLELVFCLRCKCGNVGLLPLPHPPLLGCTRGRVYVYTTCQQVPYPWGVGPAFKLGGPASQPPSAWDQPMLTPDGYV